MDEIVELYDSNGCNLIYDNLHLKLSEFVKRIEKTVAFCIKNRKLGVKKEEQDKQKENKEH